MNAIASVILVVILGCACSATHATPLPLPARTQTVVYGTTDAHELGGLLLVPEGRGPFPAVLYNHGSAPGMASNTAFANIAPTLVERGWVVFMPYRRGQGLSAAAAPFIGSSIEAARKADGMTGAAATQLRLLETEQLDDQIAALAWLKNQPFVDASRVAAAGNSLGGIEVLLGVERGGYCAGLDAAGAAQSWSQSPDLRHRLLRAARHAPAPVFFFQAANDYDLSPTHALAAEMLAAGTPAEAKIYPTHGSSHAEGHAFAYDGVRAWYQDALRFLERACPGPRPSALR